MVNQPIAIVGIGTRFPGEANTPDAFWRLLVDGVSAIALQTPERMRCWPDVAGARPIRGIPQNAFRVRC